MGKLAAVSCLLFNFGIAAATHAGVCGLHLQVARGVLFDPMTHAKTIAQKGLRLVQIDHERIKHVANELAQSNYQVRMAAWNVPPYPPESASFDKMFEYFLVLNSINFMYLDPASGRTFGEGTMVGAARAAEVLTEHWDQISQPGFLARIDIDQANQLFRSQHPLPEMPARVRHLRAVGEFLDRYRLKTSLEKNEWLNQFPRALDLALFVARTIPGFEDPFVKRAQLFVGMLVGRFHASAVLPEKLRDTEGMTVYADYILPMVLARLGILRYSNELKKKIAAGKLIRSGTRAENEIRATTLIAAEELRSALNQTERYKEDSINVLALDAALWLQGGEIEFPGSRMPEKLFYDLTTKHHLTQTSDY